MIHFSKSILFVLLLFFGSACSSFIPKTTDLPAPARTSWKPDGCPNGTPGPAYRTLHADEHNSDEAAVAIGPTLKVDWVAEPGMFIVEGPTFDRAGNIYFSPLFAQEPVFLVSLEPGTGRRRWAISGPAPAGGAPLVIPDPDDPGRDLIFAANAERALAVREDGSVIWDVPTGLTGDQHCFGLNYCPARDAIVGVLLDGRILVLSRQTGRDLLAAPYAIPGGPSPGSNLTRLPAFIWKRMGREMARFAGEGPEVENFYPLLIEALLGGGSKVANYFAVDQASGRLWVAGTAPDGEDGQGDGVSEYGALYALDLEESPAGLTVREAFHVSFQGGSASTPTLNGDGSRAYVADNFGKMIAIDAKDGHIIWDLDVGEQIVASIHVAADNREIYASTATRLVKVTDLGDRGELAWKSNMNMYQKRPGFHPVRLTAAVVTANGIGTGAGVGLKLLDFILPLRVGAGVVDRETGELRSYLEGPEESVAVVAVGPDGAIYFAHSPVRRAMARALLPGLTHPLTGGIARYAPADPALLARDAVCAAADRLENALAHKTDCPDPFESEVGRVQLLLGQAEAALAQSDPTTATHLRDLRSSLDTAGSDHVSQLRSACEALGRP